MAKKAKKKIETASVPKAVSYTHLNRAVHAIYEFTTGRTKPLAIALVILAVLGGLYGPMRDYYVAYRTGDILARQLQVSERYNKLSLIHIWSTRSRFGTVNL